MKLENLKPATSSKYNNQFKKGTEVGSWLILDDNLKRSITNGHCYVLCICTKCSLTMEYVREYSLLNGNSYGCDECALQNRSLGKIGEIPISKIHRWQEGARKRNLTWKLSNEYLDILWKSQNGLCALTGVKLSFEKKLNRGMRRASLDRKNSRIGYLEGNVQFVSVEINRLKGTLSDKKLRTICKLVTKKQQLDIKLNKQNVQQLDLFNNNSFII